MIIGSGQRLWKGPDDNGDLCWQQRHWWHAAQYKQMVQTDYVGSALVATPKISLFIELAACSHICPKDGHFVAFNFPNEQSVEEKGCQSLDLQRKRKEGVQSCSNQFG